jgi:hypothetical protein
VKIVDIFLDRRSHFVNITRTITFGQQRPWSSPLV